MVPFTAISARAPQRPSINAVLDLLDHFDILDGDDRSNALPCARQIDTLLRFLGAANHFEKALVRLAKGYFNHRHTPQPIRFTIAQSYHPASTATAHPSERLASFYR